MEYHTGQRDFYGPVSPYLTYCTSYAFQGREGGGGKKGKKETFALRFRIFFHNLLTDGWNAEVKPDRKKESLEFVIKRGSCHLSINQSLLPNGGLEILLSYIWAARLLALFSITFLIPELNGLIVASFLRWWLCNLSLQWLCQIAMLMAEYKSLSSLKWRGWLWPWTRYHLKVEPN